MDRTPLLRWQNSRTFLGRANCSVTSGQLISRTLLKGAFRQACTRGVPSLTTSATVLLLPNFTAAPPRTHAVGVLAAGAWSFHNNFFLGPPP